jgi:hypothetical protein
MLKTKYKNVATFNIFFYFSLLVIENLQITKLSQLEQRLVWLPQSFSLPTDLYRSVRKAPEVSSGSLARELGGQIGTYHRFCRSAHWTMVPSTSTGVLWLFNARRMG